MGSSNDKIVKEETEQERSRSSSSEIEIDLSPVHIDDYDLKGSSKEEMFKFIVSNYALMNKRIKESNEGIKKELKRANKAKTVPPQSPDRLKRKVIPHLRTVVN